MKIVLASRNKHKISELEALLRKYIPDIEILSLDDIGFEGDIAEDGETFEENAFIKAYTAAGSGYIGIGDDSGLSVRALGGAPGVYSARYAGEHGNDAANNERLLSELANEEDRYAEFVCTVACVLPDDREHGYFFRGTVEGRIIDEYRGHGGFGYDPIFSPDGERSFAEMPLDEKNAVSHRGNAFRLLKDRLRELGLSDTD